MHECHVSLLSRFLLLSDFHPMCWLFLCSLVFIAGQFIRVVYTIDEIICQRSMLSSALSLGGFSPCMCIFYIHGVKGLMKVKSFVKCV